MNGQTIDQSLVSLLDVGQKMTKKNDGLFSQSLKSLEIQLKTLFYGSGNERSIAFLDSLSNLGLMEQELVLKRFTKIIDRILSGDNRLLTEEDIAQKEIENEIYSDIIGAMNEAVKIEKLSGKRLEVLDGGKKNLNKNVLIDLSQAKKGRKHNLKPVLN